MPPHVGVGSAGPLLERNAGARHHGADDEARLASTLEGMLRIVQVFWSDDHDHPDSHVEGTEHLVVADTAPGLDEAKDRGDVPGSAPDPRPQARRQDPRNVPWEAPSGDVGEGAELSPFQKRLESREIRAVGGEKCRTHGRAEFGQARVDSMTQEIEEDLAGQGVAVRMKARRREGQQDVSLANARGDRLRPLHHTDDESRKVVVAGGVGPRHFSGLAADEGTAELGAPARKARDDRFDAGGIHLPECDVVEEEQGNGALHENIVDAVGDEVVSHRVVYTRGDGDLYLGANAIGRSHENRLAVAGEVWAEHPTEGADLGENAPVEGPFGQALDACLGLVGRGDVYARVAVVHFGRNSIIRLHLGLAAHGNAAVRCRSAREEAQMIKEGQEAPDFTLPSSGGGEISLRALRGKNVVLYFYPKDDTPGCTKEACAFRDSQSKIKKSGAVVLGVSPDSLASHDKFRTKYKLNFPLLADSDKAVAKKYGAFGEKVMYGKRVVGMIRSTFVIDGAGVVRKVFPRVRVDGHDEQVLGALDGL
jgi:peroxiredoxin Q/BCP